MSAETNRKPHYQMLAGVPFPGGWHRGVLQSALKYRAEPGQLFVVSYPKSGTTWTQMVVFLIRSGGKPAARLEEFHERVPFLELFGVEALLDVQAPVAIKTHLPVDLAPFAGHAKYIYVTRNPKDVVVSLFHHTRTPGYLFEDGTFDQFFELFMDGQAEFGDFFQHVRGWYEHREDHNVLFLTYEEMKKDLKSCVSRIARFMGRKFSDDLDANPETMDNVLKYSSLQEMKKLFSVENFLSDLSLTKENIDAMSMPFGLKHLRKFIIDHRKPDSKYVGHVRSGATGGWRKVLSEEQARRMDDKIERSFCDTYLTEIWQ